MADEMIEMYAMMERLRKQAIHYTYLVEQMTDEDIDRLLQQEAEKIRKLCHGYKSIEVSPLLFHYALEQRIQQSNDLRKKMRRTYFDILNKLNSTIDKQPKTKGDIREVRDIYKDQVRPMKAKIRQIWAHIFNNIHMPNQREDTKEWIMGQKLRKETVAEEASMTKGEAYRQMRPPEGERRNPLLSISSKKRRKQFVHSLKGSNKSKNRQFIQSVGLGQKQNDLEAMKNEKLEQLDDSVRYLGKEIDPYSAQHKKDANFYREVLLQDADLIPQSRKVISKSQILRIKEERHQPKTTRELFNKKNFKTASIHAFDIRPFDKTKLMKDIDLRDYVPDFRVNNMDLKSFKIELPHYNKATLFSSDSQNSSLNQLNLKSQPTREEEQVIVDDEDDEEERIGQINLNLNSSPQKNKKSLIWVGDDADDIQRSLASENDQALQNLIAGQQSPSNMNMDVIKVNFELFKENQTHRSSRTSTFPRSSSLPREKATIQQKEELIQEILERNRKPSDQFNEDQDQDDVTKFVRKQNETSSSYSQKHLSVQRNSRIVKGLNQERRLQRLELLSGGKESSSNGGGVFKGLLQNTNRKSKLLQNFFSSQNPMCDTRQPLSTNFLLEEAKKTLEKQVREAKKDRIIQMELNKKRNAAYIPEMRKKDILNQKKKIQSEPIDLERQIYQVKRKTRDANDGGSNSESQGIDDDSDEQAMLSKDLQILEEEDQLLLNISDLTLANAKGKQKATSNIVTSHPDPTQFVTDSSIAKIDKERQAYEIKMFNKQSNQQQQQQTHRKIISTKDKDSQAKPNAQTNNDTKQGNVMKQGEKGIQIQHTTNLHEDKEIFKAKNSRLPSAIPHSARKIQFLLDVDSENVNSQNTQLKKEDNQGNIIKIKSTQSRLASAKVVGSLLSSQRSLAPNKDKERVSTARGSSNTRGMSATTRPQTAFNSSHKTQQTFSENLLQNKNHLRSLKQLQSQAKNQMSLNFLNAHSHLHSHRPGTSNSARGTVVALISSGPALANKSPQSNQKFDTQREAIKQGLSKNKFNSDLNQIAPHIDIPHTAREAKSTQNLLLNFGGMNRFQGSSQAFDQFGQEAQQSHTHSALPMRQKDIILQRLQNLSKECVQERRTLRQEGKVIDRIQRKEDKRLDKMQENIEQKFLTVIELGQKKDALKEFRYDKHTFIYGKSDASMGHYLRADGYDRVEVSERISKLNGKYAFMAENIKL